MDSQQLGDSLRTRRRALQPEDVGLPRRARRRTEGLRREDVAELSAMSHDYYARLEGHRSRHRPFPHHHADGHGGRPARRR